MRTAIAVVMVLATVYSAHAFGMGKLGLIFGKEGLPSKGGIAPTPPPPGCASPTAPDGSVDLSQCSNAYYVAVIL